MSDKATWNKEGTKVRHVLSGYSGYILDGESVHLTNSAGVDMASVNFWNTDRKCFERITCCREELEQENKA